jgi:DeoR family suf operon transcriptional repressor
VPAEGSSQREVLARLLDRKGGMTVDELAGSMGLSRTAINQHAVELERGGYVRRTTARRTGGRPGRVYVLTDAGANLFPKKYSWFSALLLQSLREQMGEERVGAYMHDLGVRMSAVAIPRLIGKTRIERIVEIVKIMNEAGFAAKVTAPDGEDRIPRIECKNCVYHDLSKNFPEVCRFDLGFLGGLMGAEVEHQECMQRGGEACRFRFVPPA